MQTQVINPLSNQNIDAKTSSSNSQSSRMGTVLNGIGSVFRSIANTVTRPFQRTPPKIAGREVTHILAELQEKKEIVLIDVRHAHAKSKFYSRISFYTLITAIALAALAIAFLPPASFLFIGAAILVGAFALTSITTWAHKDSWSKEHVRLFEEMNQLDVLKFALQSDPKGFANKAQKIIVESRKPQDKVELSDLILVAQHLRHLKQLELENRADLAQQERSLHQKLLLQLQAVR